MAQKSLLLNAGLQFVEYNAINIEFLDFEFPEEAVEALIFTSQNGVHSFLDNKGDFKVLKKKVFCVGEKTKSLLERNGFEVSHVADSSMELGQILVKAYSNKRFLLFSGNLRRDELPEVLKENKVWYHEIITYRTTANPKKFKAQFDGVLFFSPSGVASYAQQNTIPGKAFCIGQTTAEEVKKYTNNYSVANKPTVENVIVQAVKQLSFNDQERFIP